MGRPSKISSIFQRRITKRTPGTFHSRVIIQGIIPSLHVSYKSTKIMTYDLRRLRLHCLIERIPHTHRYRITDLGRRVAFLFTKVHSRILCPGLSQLFDGCSNAPKRPITAAMAKLDQALETLFKEAKLAPCES